MQHLKKTFYFLLCWILIAACGSNNSATNESSEVKLSSTDSLKQVLKEEVMVIHDDAMAKMGMLYDLEIAVKNTIDSTNSESVKKAGKVIDKLQTANKDMMDWMKQYKEPEFEDKNKLTQYFEAQMKLITKVKVDTDSSILEANELLEANKKK
jgi:hypothetical protein